MTMAKQSVRVRIIRAKALMFTSRDVLADFEAELIAEVHRRVMDDPAALAAVTPAEMAVIDDALAAMLKAPRQDLTAAGLAA